MHRTLIRLSLVLATGVLALAGTPARAQQDTPAPALLAAVNIIVPELYRTAAGDGEPTRVPAPTVLAEGDRLITDTSGVALITWINNGSETVVGEDTTVTVTRLEGIDNTNAAIALDLAAGHLIAGMPGSNGSVAWELTTPTLTVTLFDGRFDITVERDGSTLIIVTAGQVQVRGTGGDEFTLAANEFLTAGPDGGIDAPRDISDDGISVSLEGVCTATAATNVNVRAAPSEESRRLGGIKAGEVLWVRSATEGSLWLNIYYTPGETGIRSAFGWIYGPAALLDEDDCDSILRAPLDAVLFDGPGIIQAQNSESGGETDGEATSPLATAEASDASTIVEPAATAPVG
ncbi:MAG TPA: hypothetical protein PKD09_18750 [Aggregatilinea sp.]|uniref:hypothetical protein n=1 Tax=Aggregatilinea sp. TaxID=2806333 RepID=UPI002C685C07|nr:hypothetical protein [Aggregatilinea sp.]HML23703.1 hypothetical protein [Aggregatilinea sp.]